MYRACLEDLDRIQEAVALPESSSCTRKTLFTHRLSRKLQRSLQPKKPDPLYEGRGEPQGVQLRRGRRVGQNRRRHLIRTGTHPLSAILWLKQQEALASGREIRVQSVLADMACVTPGLTAYEHRHFAAKPYDVEDTSTCVISFTDGTRAVVIACDTLLGGSKNYVELYCNDAALSCTLTLNNLMSSYLLDEDGLDDVPCRKCCPANAAGIIPSSPMRSYGAIPMRCRILWSLWPAHRQPRSGLALASDTGC